MKPPDGLKFRITGSDPANNAITVTVTARACDRCGSDQFLTSALNRADEPVWLCRACIDLLDNGRAIAPPKSHQNGSTPPPGEQT